MKNSENFCLLRAQNKIIFMKIKNSAIPHCEESHS